MTALQLNAELFRELSIIAEDENLMKKAVKYLKKLSAKSQQWDGLCVCYFDAFPLLQVNLFSLPLKQVGGDFCFYRFLFFFK